MVQMIKNTRGREFPRRDYRRIVSLVPSWTESLFVLGSGDRVVAITDYCTEPKAAVASVPRIGGTKNPRVEQILSLQPDLVIANIEENRRADILHLEAADIPAFVTDARTVSQGMAELKALGELVGAENIGATLEPIQQERTSAKAERVRVRHPRAFVAIWKNPWITVNASTFVNDMLELSGGENIFRDRERQFPLAADLRLKEPRESPAEYDTRYPRVSLDEIIERAPEVILLPDEPYPFTQKDADEWNEHREVPAVQRDKVLLLDGKLLSWYGVRMASSLRVLRKLLHENETSAPY